MRELEGVITDYLSRFLDFGINAESHHQFPKSKTFVSEHQIVSSSADSQLQRNLSAFCKTFRQRNSRAFDFNLNLASK